MDTLLDKLKHDPTGYINKSLRLNNLKLIKYISTLKMRIIMKIKGIHFGNNTGFLGNTIFVRYPESDIKIGTGCTFISNKTYNLAGINRNCIISTMAKNAKMNIGNCTGISGAVISSFNSIDIGKNVLIGANAFISDHDWHNIDPTKRNLLSEYSRPVKIEDNVWIGMNAVILKGVAIGKNSVIGANSIVTHDIPANVIAAGNPCKIIRHLNVS